MKDYFEDVKNYLDITFDDPDTDKKLLGICSRAEAYLNNRAGKDLFFSINMENRTYLQLLFDCIRYVWSGGLDDFATNYADDLMMLRLNCQAEGDES